jgi:hypothetical protein
LVWEGRQRGQVEVGIEAGHPSAAHGPDVDETNVERRAGGADVAAKPPGRHDVARADDLPNLEAGVYREHQSLQKVAHAAVPSVVAAPG